MKKTLRPKFNMVMNDNEFIPSGNGYSKGPELNRGAQGIVYAGRIPDGKPCVLKEYELEPAKHEYAMLCRVKERNTHLAHVVYCFDGFQQDKLFVIAEERLWKPITDILRVERLAPRMLAHLAIGSTRALREMATAGLAHCEIKPDSFMLSEHTERCVLIDLGLAIPFGDKTRGYSDLIAAPEVIAGSPCPQSDCYSWARTWELLLTGMGDIGPTYRVTDVHGAQWVSQSFAELIRICTNSNPTQRMHPHELAQKVHDALSRPVQRGGGMQFPDATTDYPY